MRHSDLALRELITGVEITFLMPFGHKALPSAVGAPASVGPTRLVSWSWVQTLHALIVTAETLKFREISAGRKE